MKRRRWLINARGILGGLQTRSREKKYELFVGQLCPDTTTRILDVGAGSGTFLEEIHPYRELLVAVDRDWAALAELRRCYPQVRAVCADALALPFIEKTFGIVFSNAVVEHVGGWDKQTIFAREIERVGQLYFVTTPNRWFPIEQHYRLPFFQFFPQKWQRWIHRFVIVGFVPRGRFEEINLLSFRQVKQLFPSAHVVRQRITFWPETLIVYKSR